MPALSAASSTVVPSGTSTLKPSIVSETVFNFFSPATVKPVLVIGCLHYHQVAFFIPFMPHCRQARAQIPQTKAEELPGAKRNISNNIAIDFFPFIINICGLLFQG